MLLALNKKFLWFIVIWFAALQAVSPFIHGHMEADTPTQGYGFHMHMHMQEVAQSFDKVHTLESLSASVHTIGVDKALVKGLDVLPLPLFTVLFVLFLFALATNFLKPGFTFPSRLPLYLRPRSKPRAPPFFLNS